MATQSIIRQICVEVADEADIPADDIEQMYLSFMRAFADNIRNLVAMTIPHIGVFRLSFRATLKWATSKRILKKGLRRSRNFCEEFNKRYRYHQAAREHDPHKGKYWRNKFRYMKKFGEDYDESYFKFRV